MFKNLILTSLCSFILIVPSCVQSQDDTSDEVNFHLDNNRDKIRISNLVDAETNNTTYNVKGSFSDFFNLVSYTTTGYYFNSYGFDFTNSRFSDLSGYGQPAVNSSFNSAFVTGAEIYTSELTDTYDFIISCFSYYNANYDYVYSAIGYMFSNTFANWTMFDFTAMNPYANYISRTSSDYITLASSFGHLNSLPSYNLNNSFKQYSHAESLTIFGFDDMNYVGGTKIGNYLLFPYIFVPYGASAVSFIDSPSFLGCTFDVTFTRNAVEFDTGYLQGVEIGYNEGYNDGVNATYNSAYDSGYTAGQAAGYDIGYSAGYDSGVSYGESVGYDSGYDEGHDAGYAEGNSFGYTNGFNNGVASANDYSFTNLFASIADTPILMIRSLFDFDFFGVNLLTVVLSLFTALVLFYLLRKLL